MFGEINGRRIFTYCFQVVVIIHQYKGITGDVTKGAFFRNILEAYGVSCLLFRFYVFLLLAPWQKQQRAREEGGGKEWYYV